MDQAVDVRALKRQTAGAADESVVRFPHPDGSRIPYKVFSSQDVYDREQERIYRGPTWNFVALDAEIAKPGDYKSTFVGDTPVVVTRTGDGGLAAWVNRCSHRGAQLCRNARGNAASHTCVYHQWSFDASGNLQGVPFRRGLNGAPGMPSDFDPKNHGLRKLDVASYRGLVFASFGGAPALQEYLGEQMRPWIDRVMCKPVVYLGCTRQYARSNWKLYYENVKDPYHASLLHLFHTTFNIFRVGMKARCIPDAKHGLHSIITSTKIEDTADTATAYKQQQIRSMDEGFHLEDDSVLGFIKEHEESCTNHIQTIFPQLVLQQIHNTLVARQVLPKAPGEFELVFHFFGYEDDTSEMRQLRIKQANLVGPAGYISMEDTEATELVQRATLREGESTSVLELGRSDPDRQDTMVTESLIRRFWSGYQQVMGY